MYVEVGKELRTRDELAAIGVKAFCPYTLERRRSKVRGQNRFTVKKVNEPLFPRYIFATNVIDHHRVKNTRGVIDFIRAGGYPLEIPDRIMELTVLAMADATGLIGQVDKTQTNFHAQPGDQFNFDTRSPLHGLIGRISNLDAIDTKGEIKAWIEIFGSSREVVVPANMVGTVIASQQTTPAPKVSSDCLRLKTIGN